MYADNTLTPKEAVRLCALGILAASPHSYGGLANAIRHFVSRILGPSLDVLGTSVELLKYEGLVEAVSNSDANSEAGEDAVFAITENGRRELHDLLTSNVRTGATELNKLIFALKFRFLHLLDVADQRAQADHLVEVSESELARLDDLRQHHAGADGYFVRWLDHDIEMLESRLAWMIDFRDGLRA
jgi:DNA-binding PadR family transcriptional regulator